MYLPEACNFATRKNVDCSLGVARKNWMILARNLNFNGRISGDIYVQSVASAGSHQVPFGDMPLWVTLLFDEADVAAPFHARDSNIEKIVCVYAKAHVFVQIMRRDMVAPHHG